MLLVLTRLNKFRSIISVSKITHWMWHDDTFSKRNKVAKKAGGGQAIQGNFIK